MNSSSTPITAQEVKDTMEFLVKYPYYDPYKKIKRAARQLMLETYEDDIGNIFLKIVMRINGILPTFLSGGILPTLLSEEEASLLCGSIVKYIKRSLGPGFPTPTKTDAAHKLLSHYISQANERVRDEVIPWMVLYDL